VSSQAASHDPPIRAAYGLRLVGVDGAGFLEPAGDRPWPEVRVLQSRGKPNPVGEWWLNFGGRQACLEVPGGLLRLHRATSVMTVRSERPLPEDLFVHPWLTAGAGMFARWHGREAFHGGAFVAPSGEAWAVFAPKEGGKSTLLGWLAQSRHGVISDDLLVIDGDHALAGPRCVDLRPGTGAALGLDDLQSARGSARDRLVLAPVPAEVPLAGIVYLTWSDGLDVRTVPLDERIPRLRRHNAFQRLPAGESALLRLAALPTLELRRPRRIEAVGASGEALLAATT
jgi:hypothetical protein